VLFEALDFLYVPSADVAAEVAYFTDVLGAELVFAIEAMGTRVAMVRTAADSPGVILAGHLHGERPVLVHRVADLAAAAAELDRRGWAVAGRFDIPHGPCCALTAPGGHRIAMYELTRPEVPERFAGRRDF
jgi:glyoxalase/bleomycin resistance protein/dioxygenase superfamily protein